MKRENIKTTIEKRTRRGLEIVARDHNLKDHGLYSKGRAIDFLVNNYLVNKAGSTPQTD
jgi:hypothetical protein